MNSDAEPKHDESDPGYFVVELADGDSLRYAVCQRLLLVDASDGIPGVSAEVLRKYFEHHAVRAIPLPSADPCGDKPLAFMSQSGVNIVINRG